MPRGPRKLAIEFGATTLTHYGGVYLLHRFLSRLGFKDALARQVRLSQRNNRYTVGELLLALLYPIILGLERIETTWLLQQNGVFQFLTGLPSYPNPSTLRRFLLRLAPTALPDLRRLHDRFAARALEQPRRPTRLLFDLDSTVVVVYGNQEQARVGYNPRKRGRPSYHPLLCFEGQTKDFWHGELRPGDVPSASGILTFLPACFARVPPGVRAVIVRGDKGFYDHKTIEWLEGRRARFVIVAKLTQPIKRRLAHLKYVSVSRGVEAAEFHYQPIGWPRPYRFVVIRRPSPDEPSEQLTLFQLGQYAYQVLVTNLPLRPLNLWRFYNARAGVERIIRALKGDYPLGKIPSRFFAANEAYFHVLLIAYNIMNWFKRLCLPSELHSATLETLRHRVLLMPAQLTRTGNRPRLTLAARGPQAAAWRHAVEKIEQLKL
jgi:hypothetical protein